MKLLLLLISMAMLSMAASTCKKSSAESSAPAVDSLSAVHDSLSIDTVVTGGLPVSPDSTSMPKDSLSKEEKAQSAGTKHEAPKHGSANQEKVDSIKNEKKKKKE